MMTDTQPSAEAAAMDLARECVYRFLAAAVSDPREANWGLASEAASLRLAGAALDLLRAEAEPAAGPLGFGELPPESLDLQPLLSELPAQADHLVAEYDRVFGLVPARECPPYETEYHPSAETFFRAQQLADIAGSYRAFGLLPSRARPERPDHLCLELEFMAFLLLKKRLALADAGREAAAERASVCDGAQRAFFRDHLAWWVPAFAAGLRRKAGGGFYAALGRLLAALVFAERCRCGVPAPRLPVQAALIERPEEQAGCAGCSAPG
jgi:TorA maturation chaperone TorD